MSSKLPRDTEISVLVNGGGEGRWGPAPKRGAEEERGIQNDEGVFEELEMEG